MAEKLGVTPSYLSAVEVGKRKVPKKWPRLIADIYDLSQEEYEELVWAKDMSLSSVTISLDNLEGADKQIALAFARSFDALSEADKENISKILLKRRD